MVLNENHVIIGIGGTGGNILKAIRKRYFLEVPSEEERRNTPLGFVYVDSSRELMQPNDPTWKVLGENAQLGQENFLFIRNANLAEQLENVDNYPGVKDWLGDRGIWDNLVGAVANDGAAAQRRRLGRFLFACSANEYIATLMNQVTNIRAKSGRNDVTFHIVAGLAGGTGSGSIVDVIAQTRKHFKPVDQNQKYRIVVYCLVPERDPQPNWDAGFYHANGFAALQELNALYVKRFIPHDVSGEYEFAPIEDVDRIFDTCFLFTNTNENGITVDTAHALPEIVSDLIFHYMSLSVDDTTRAFNNAYTGENLADNDREINEQAETKAVAIHEKPVRTRRFNAFGIKRIVNPEEEIKEYFTYSFARQAVLQLKFNNWSDDLGYRDQPRNEDYVAIVTDRATLNGWKFSEAHLMLSLPILPSEMEQNWRTIQDDWNNTIPNLANAAWEREAAGAINELARLCGERFEHNFRRVGVPEFYRTKEQARRDVAKEVVQTIERDLFSQWQTGQKSVYDIERLMVTLVNQSEIRLEALNGRIVSKTEEIDRSLAEKRRNEYEWAHIGVVSDLLGKKRRLYQAQTTLLQQLYVKKTELEGLRFAKILLAEIINELQLLNNEVGRFSNNLTVALNASDREIASHCREGRITPETFRETVVKYYDTHEVRQFVQRITRDTDIQSTQCSAIRNAIAELTGAERTFTRLNENATADSLMDIFSETSRESSIHAHDQLLVDRRRRLIGINIVEKLKEQYGGFDRQAELDEFARNVMESSGVFLNFNQTEIIRQLTYSDPPRPGVLTMIKSTLISIPGSPDNQDFVNRLIAAFRRNAVGGRTVYVDTESERRNEITVINLTSGFSLRMVNDIRILKERYDRLVERGNNTEIARLVLHLDGDGLQYPNVFALNAAEIERRRLQLAEENERRRLQLAADALPYTLIALARNYIVWQDRLDGTGKKAYCVMKTDEDGYALPPIILGEKVTDLLTAQSIDEAFVEEMTAEVKKALANEYLHITKREELRTFIRETINTKVLPECRNNPADNTYLRFRDAAREASQILNN